MLLARTRLPRLLLGRPLPSLAIRGLAASGGAAQPFMLSDIGEGIAEVEITRWFVKPGDAVQEFDKLCEVQSDKATVEISSPFDGVIESLAYDVGAIQRRDCAPLYRADGAADAEEPAVAVSSAPGPGAAGDRTSPPPPPPPPPALPPPPPPPRARRCSQHQPRVRSRGSMADRCRRDRPRRARHQGRRACAHRRRPCCYCDGPAGDTAAGAPEDGAGRRGPIRADPRNPSCYVCPDDSRKPGPPGPLPSHPRTPALACARDPTRARRNAGAPLWIL